MPRSQLLNPCMGDAMEDGHAFYGKPPKGLSQVIESTPMTVSVSQQECVYLIRDDETGLHKIGITSNWARRSRQLQVGRGSTAVRLVPCADAKKWERVLHAQFRHKRLPQSEWFRITEEEALPKMQWLAHELAKAKEGSIFVVGRWQQAKAGHYYRRRKSKNGHWYTETKSWNEIQQDREQYLVRRAVIAEREAVKRARREPGFWPVPGTTDVTWQDKDPLLARQQRNALFLLSGLLGLAVVLASSNPILLFVAVPLACGIWFGFTDR